MSVSERYWAYESHCCGACGRDYLFPSYGGREVCNDCMFRVQEQNPQSRHFGEEPQL